VLVTWGEAPGSAFLGGMVWGRGGASVQCGGQAVAHTQKLAYCRTVSVMCCDWVCGCEGTVCVIVCVCTRACTYLFCSKERGHKANKKHGSSTSLARNFEQ